MELAREGDGIESWVDRVSSRIWERVEVERDDRRAAEGAMVVVRLVAMD